MSSVTKNHMPSAKQSQSNKGTGSANPWPDLYASDRATHVDSLSQGPFKKVKQIVVVGLEDPDLEKIRKKLDSLQGGEIHPDDLSDKEKHVLEQTHFIPELGILCTHEPDISVRIEVEDNGFTKDFKTALEGLGMNITPDAEKKCSETAGTLLYDVRWPEDGKTDKKSGVRRLADWKGNNPPVAFLAPNASIEGDKNSKEYAADYQ